MDNPAQIFAAAHAPVAPYTWEVRADILGTEESTRRIPVQFLRPVEILGAFPVVTPLRQLGGDPLVVPTVEDLDVRLDLNSQERFTNRLEGGATTGGDGATQVSLAAMNVFIPRLLRIQAGNAAPDFGVQFTWRQFIAGTPLFENARVSLAFFCRYLTRSEIERLRGSVG